MTLLDDYKEEALQKVLIQPFIRNNGYGDIFGEGRLHDCIVSYEVKDVTKADGSKTVSSMQITVDGSVVVTDSDKATYGGYSPKILAVEPVFDSEKADEVYEVIIYT